MAKTLEQEAMESRRGANEVQDSFLRILEVGSPSVAELAYAIKARVKDDFKIVEKVKGKRAEGRDYGVKNLRDIVGIRIVTLYRLDALGILPIFLQRILENSGTEESNLFLADSLEEIKIYSVNPEGDAQNLASRVEGIFREHGFADKCVVERKQENYTSVHMVFWARAKWNKKFVEVPVEVQLRTALEDVWAEMDHQLKYKRSVSAGDSNSLSMMENCLAHLNVMKTLNDGLAQYGDQVKIQIDEINNSLRRQSRIRLAEEPEKRLSSFGEYTGELRERVRDMLGESREVVESEVSHFEINTRSVNNLRKVSSKIELFLDQLEQLPINDDFKDELRYVGRMELALVQFELANRLGGGVSGNSHYVKSQSIYNEMESLYPSRGIVQYRLARVLWKLGQKAQARDKMKNLVEHFQSFDLPSDHWVHASACRILGFWHWDGVERTGPSREDPVVEDAREAVLEAAVCSLKASEIKVSDVTHPAEVPAHESPRVMALSNLAFFVVEFLEAGGSWTQLGARGISKEVFRQAQDELRQFDVDAAVDFHKLNTLRRVYLYENNVEGAQEVATIAVRVLEDAGFRDRGGATVEEHVLRVCHKTMQPT